jgi:hypothetical protein
MTLRVIAASAHSSQPTTRVMQGEHDLNADLPSLANLSLICVAPAPLASREHWERSRGHLYAGLVPYAFAGRTLIGAAAADGR